MRALAGDHSHACRIGAGQRHTHGTPFTVEPVAGRTAFANQQLLTTFHHIVRKHDTVVQPGPVVHSWRPNHDLLRPNIAGLVFSCEIAMCVRAEKDDADERGRHRHHPNGRNEWNDELAIHRMPPVTVSGSPPRAIPNRFQTARPYSDHTIARTTTSGQPLTLGHKPGAGCVSVAMAVDPGAAFKPGRTTPACC